ncbi:MAG: hypothetical protein QM490_03280 [Candidatus Gracilibacteria bacterium]
MKNLRAYSDSTFDFHKSVISKKSTTKDDPDFKIRASSYNNDIETCLENYDEKFNVNKLEELIEYGYSGNEKDTLHKLYRYKASVFQKLKVKITTRDGNIIDNICQNCTISEVNSFDHVLPKEDFSEYVVNPKNLFPSCTKCNSYKSTVWVKNGKRAFLNLYKDILPEVQYLFVDVQIDANDLNLTYSVSNINCINIDLYNLIYNHYDKLHLCQRFKENSDLVVSELENEIYGYKAVLSIDIIKQVIVGNCSTDKEIYGHNYWKSILKLALLNNSIYMNKFL